MPKVKKIPQRQCVGCREMKDKKSLLRVVKSPEGTVSLESCLTDEHFDDWFERFIDLF